MIPKRDTFDDEYQFVYGLMAKTRTLAAYRLMSYRLSSALKSVLGASFEFEQQDCTTGNCELALAGSVQQPRRYSSSGSAPAMQPDQAASGAEIDDNLTGPEMRGRGGGAAGEAHIRLGRDRGQFFGGVTKGLSYGAGTLMLARKRTGGDLGVMRLHRFKDRCQWLSPNMRQNEYIPPYRMRKIEYNRTMPKKTHYDMARLFVALSNETRLRLLALLSDREICVCELVEALKQPQPKISQHLATLRKAGIVQARRAGKWMQYRIVTPPDKQAEKILHSTLVWLRKNRDLGAGE